MIIGLLIFGLFPCESSDALKQRHYELFYRYMLVDRYASQADDDYVCKKFVESRQARIKIQNYKRWLQRHIETKETREQAFQLVMDQKYALDRIEQYVHSLESKEATILDFGAFPP